MQSLRRTASVLSVALIVAGCVTVKTAPEEVPPKQPEEIENPFFGDYSTDRIRGMWGICFVSSSSKNPAFPPPLHAIYCDCMVNKVRGRYSQRHLGSIENTEELNNIMRGVAQECVDEVIYPVYPQSKPKAEKTSEIYG